MNIRQREKRVTLLGLNTERRQQQLGGDQFIADLDAQKAVRWINDAQYQEALRQYQATRDAIRRQLEGQVNAGVRFGEPDARKVTEADVNKVLDEARAIPQYLSKGDIKQAQDVADWYNQTFGDYGSAVLSTVMSAGAKGLKTVAGVLRPLGAVGLPQPYEWLRNQGLKEEIAAARMGETKNNQPESWTHWTIVGGIKLAGQALDVPRMALPFFTPLGKLGGVAAPTSFAATNFLESYGSGANAKQVATETGKGYLLGSVFGPASQIEEKLADSGARTILSKAAKYGTIFLGATGTEIAGGTPPKQALSSGVGLVLFDALVTHAGETGQSVAKVARQQVGKVFDIVTNGKKTRVAINSRGGIVDASEAPDKDVRGTFVGTDEVNKATVGIPATSNLQAGLAPKSTVSAKDGTKYQVLEDRGDRLIVQEIKPDGTKSTISLKRSNTFTDLAEYRNAGEASDLAKEEREYIERAKANQLARQKAQNQTQSRESIAYNGKTVEIYRNPKLSPEERQIENATVERLKNNVSDLVAKYYAKHGTQVINADLAKELFKEYEANSLENNEAVKAAASTLARLIFQERLEALPKGSYVMLTAGGQAAGKSSRIKSSSADLIYDSTMSSKEGNREAIDRIVRAGHRGGIQFVYRNVEDAAVGMLRRTLAEGRPVTLRSLAAGHYNSLKAFLEDTDAYARNKGLPVYYFETVGRGKLPVELTIEELRKKKYDSFESTYEKARRAVKRELERHAYPEKVRQVVTRDEP